MSGIPALFIAPLRSALKSQGFPPEMLRDDGTLNPVGLLATAYNEVEFRSALWPTVRTPTRGLLVDGPPNPVLAWMRPTLVLRGGGQETVLAPWGAHPGGTVLPVLGAVVLLIGVGYALGKMT